MDIPRISGYPIDETVVREIRARQHARELEVRARRAAQSRAAGLRRLWQLLTR